MRNRYPAICLKCKRVVPANGGTYIGWLEGTRDQDGHYRQSGTYALCDKCKVEQEKESHDNAK
jgi:hypothetical protein